ncbi:hypothetical protein CC2G_006462 [Coprinopsis cinerea AmutBmut pab1-1]|nr:hypothetical protein CC2G_006462 [Coprinopsis cinerea AmutBmut pab1-1]
MEVEEDVPDEVRFVPFQYDIDTEESVQDSNNTEEVWRTFSTQEAEGPPRSPSATTVPAAGAKASGNSTAEPAGIGGVTPEKGKQREAQPDTWAPFADEAAASQWFSSLSENQAAFLIRGYFSDGIVTSGPPHREAFPKHSNFPLAAALKSARQASAQEHGRSGSKEMEEIFKGVVEAMPESVRKEILSDDSELVWNIPSLEGAGMSADLIDAQLNYMSSWLGTLVNHYMHNCEVHERLDDHLRAVKAALVLREHSNTLSDSLKGLCNLYDS